MLRLNLLFILLLTVFSAAVSAQVKIRLFSNQSPESVVFSVTEGKYEINMFKGEILTVLNGEPVVITKFKEKLAVKMRNTDGFVCDSLILTGKTGNDSFSLRINGDLPLRQYYSGDLQCFPDLGTLVLINITDIEKYISGVVKAEGGSGKYLEYFKTQAIIARTYMYKYFDKHSSDRYNLCDNTHCQAYNGLSSDSLLNKATLETRGLVILDKDKVLIISAFHSNCGGATSSSNDVWLSDQPYLKSVKDPYCLNSRNSTWSKSLALKDWVSYLRKSGYLGNVDYPSGFNFLQESRLTDYKTGSFTIPLRTVRSDFQLRSTFFSLYAKGDSVIFDGRGYGHGVGLCQEGAMEMASRGFNYKQIIDFYYSGVFITDIKNAVALP
ncbi:MAG TPA: SpoIID/LytB domain-containing protein [Bacteroidales bacterium]